MNAKTIRNIREPLKKPRPLKTSASTEQIKYHIPDPKDTVIQKSREEILSDLEILNVGISNCCFDEITLMDISRMCMILKRRGDELDSHHKDAVDRYFCTLRNACREERLDMVSRVKLLEVIELRARGWKRNENINNYFNMKIQELEQKSVDGYNFSGLTSPTLPYPLQSQSLSSSTTNVPLGHGEILRSSGKFDKPTKIAGKNYFKDEIVIRNSDSGKVMGIKGRRVHMIEELSETVISFQRVNPGARDRLVQITGPDEEAIGHAKLLVEDTIRRNASPIRDNVDISGFENSKDLEFGNPLDNQQYLKKNLQHSFSMGDASFREFSISLQIGHEMLTLTGTNAELVKTAKLVLKEFFAGQSELLEKQQENRQSSPENIMPRFELRKQSSLKNSLDNSYSSSWNHSSKRDSVSPFSSSDDDLIRDDLRSGLERVKSVQDAPFIRSPVNMGDIKPRSISLESSNVQGKVARSASVPNDTFRLFKTFPEIQQSDNDEVFSPLLPSIDSTTPQIPPPSYKVCYDREFLLKCAKSPLSHNQPANYPHIHQSFKDIICQSPVMFDPVKYEESKLQESSTICVLK